MNIPFRHKLLFSFLSGLTFAVINSLTNYFIHDKNFSWGIFTFNLLFFGFFFGFGMLFWLKRSNQKLMKSIQVELSEDEQIKYQGPASLPRGLQPEAGKLILTDQRLVFKSSREGNATAETHLLLAEIKHVVPGKTNKLLQNGIRVLCQSGEQYDFLVYERDTWLSKMVTPQ